MKKLLFVVFTLLLINSLITSSLAASLLNANEQEIIEQLKSMSSIPAEYINQAENFFIREDVNIDAAVTSEAIKNIQNAELILQANNITSFEELKGLNKEDQQKIIDNIENTAILFDAEATIDITNKVAIVSYKGTDVFESRGVVQKTGYDSSGILFTVSTIIIISLLLFILLLNKSKKRRFPLFG